MLSFQNLPISRLFFNFSAPPWNHSASSSLLQVALRRSLTMSGLGVDGTIEVILIRIEECLRLCGGKYSRFIFRQLFLFYSTLAKTHHQTPANNYDHSRIESNSECCHKRFYFSTKRPVRWGENFYTQIVDDKHNCWALNGRKAFRCETITEKKKLHGGEKIRCPIGVCGLK